MQQTCAQKERKMHPKRRRNSNEDAAPPSRTIPLDHSRTISRVIFALDSGKTFSFRLNRVKVFCLPLQRPLDNDFLRKDEQQPANFSHPASRHIGVQWRRVERPFLQAAAGGGGGGVFLSSKFGASITCGRNVLRLIVILVKCHIISLITSTR